MVFQRIGRLLEHDFRTLGTVLREAGLKAGGNREEEEEDGDQSSSE
jgi:hypothetical protein